MVLHYGGEHSAKTNKMNRDEYVIVHELND